MSLFDFPFSPGPWRWADDGLTLLDAQGKMIVKAREVGLDEDTNLLAAATALVEACRTVLAELRRFGPTDEGVESAMEKVVHALIFAKYGIPVEEGEPDIFGEQEGE